MKTTCKILIVIAATLFSINIHATTWIIDSNEGINVGSFKSIQEANDTSAVADGDTLHLIGSGISYGEVNLTKKLHIYGTGYKLPDNGLQTSNGMHSFTGIIRFNEGSEESTLQGVQTGDIRINTDSITISRCYVDDRIIVASSRTATAVSVLRNYVVGRIDLVANTANYCTDVIVANNICPGVWGSRSLAMTGNNTALFSNILITNNYFYYDVDVRNALFVNNLCRRNFYISGSVVQYNACAGTQLQTADFNLQNIDYATVFWGVDSTSSPDGQYQLRHNSPTNGMGQLGADMGPFGSETPYILSGIPNLPSILQFNTAAIVSDELEFMIRIKSNQ